MKKEKIAISIDAPLLSLLDSRVDGSMLRSRSQALEYYLRKGLQGEAITTAVLLLKGSQQHVALTSLQGMPLIRRQVLFFQEQGITRIFLVTQRPSRELREALLGMPVEIVEKEARGNGGALLGLQGILKEPFVCMSGDTFNRFDLQKLLQKHRSLGKLATMGLMTRDSSSDYGTAILDGDYIIDFREKMKGSSSHIVNAGIYVFKPGIFEMLGNSLEKDVFPKLAKIGELVGFFTYGEYEHLG